MMKVLRAGVVGGLSLTWTVVGVAVSVPGQSGTGSPGPAPAKQVLVDPPPNTQDGPVCPPIFDIFFAESGSGFSGDAARIGPAPFDLGAQLAGGLFTPSYHYDPTSDLQARILRDVLAPTPGFGTAFAFGKYGTVGVGTGAFEHSFTLLSLPSTSPNMGLALVLDYRSNASSAHPDYELFGPGFHLSGLDVLYVSSGQVGQPVQAQIWRGDGLTGTYTWDSAQVAFVRPAGMLHQLEGTVNGFVRHLPDGRAITYVD